MFFNCHKLVDSIRVQCNAGSVVEKRLVSNAMSSLASALQSASNMFKNTQNKYIKSKLIFISTRLLIIL